VHEANAGLYDEPFLRAARDRLDAGGALVVWSAERTPALAQALRSVFGDVEEQDHAVRLQDRDEHYWLYAGFRL
jgi:spermidine synthase